MLVGILVTLLFPGFILAQDYIDDCIDVAGAKHKLSESYIGPDGCNKCKCMPFGSGCTKKFCDPTVDKVEAEANLCIDNNGNIHEPGDSYTHVDGCNTCVCKEYGGRCTRKLCLQESREFLSVCNDTIGNIKFSEESWLSADGCNKCACGPLGIICTKKLCLRHDGVEKKAKTELGDIVDETGDSPCRLNDGVTKFPGDIWLTEDSCNVCTCTGMNGKIECTKEGCRVRLLRLTDPDKAYGSKSSVLKISFFLQAAILFLGYIF
ncbi:kielin/chordin-like protein [Eurytemora carolleeae]|uniref:kielin/chordin-like protein n=1 Tax=Eurytemora carolleeae TaxID=1294199 RepID=UPI000C794B09|nr:kielin/chordin-like protein [Eurytemora carolleeae]|eukprot:XP_023346184.1 kielin/chordin-like protein [Eurytemora affinis]